ncbi:MAG: nicotinate (nicotinamide) nucleotide adenylyltransferase [Ignavibacteria bacterium]|nr:nicotinate (nicotinamide) nucleotide adenylyltransferase [Ignavibacteria bacterium]
MKIGIMGGTFNPVHTGHIAFVRAFIDQIQLDQCFIIPARRSPFRMNEPLAEDMHRLQMLQLAFTDIPHTFVSDIEIKREGLSFTIDTVNEIQSQYPGVEIYLLIGEDQAHRFKEWREWKELLQRVQLCIVQRTEDANLQELIQQLIHGLNVNMPVILKSPLFDVSSTLIRDSMSNNQSITGYVPETVEEYIHSHKLYVNT